MACRKEFKSKDGKMTAVCLNYPNTPEEIEALSKKFYTATIEMLEREFGEDWGTKAIAKLKSQGKELK